MVATQFLVAGLVAAASATSLVAREDTYFASLLKRQEPGTPAYNCHDNWYVQLQSLIASSNSRASGSAITLSRSSGMFFVADTRDSH